MRIAFRLLAVILCLALVNNSFSQTIIYDTIKTGWVQAAPGKISYADFVTVDNKGDIYAQVETAPGENSLCILQNGQWKKLNDKAFDLVGHFITDQQKNIYAVAYKSLYKKKDHQWSLVAFDSSPVFQQSVQTDSRFYGFKELIGSGKKYTLVHRDGKLWTEIQTLPGSLAFNSYPKLAADKKSVIYFATKDNNKANMVQCLAGNEIKEIGQMPGDIEILAIDLEGNLFISGRDAEYKFFCKKWDGIQWSDIPLPGEITKYTSPDIRLRFGEIHLSALSADRKVGGGERFFYKLEKGAWIKLGGYNSDLTVYEPFIAKGTQYVISRKNGVFLKWETGLIIKREVYPFTFQEGMLRTIELNEALSTMRLIKEGNKYGVINNKGETLIFAATDNIKITTTPDNHSSYSFDLLIKGQHFYTSIPHIKNPFSLLVGAEEKSDPCKTCGGKGRTGGVNKTETMQGKWIDGTTTTTTRPSTMGGYQTVITKTPGYRQPSTTKVTGKTDVTSCNKCQGRGSFVKGWKNYLEYNSNNKTYTLRRETYSN